MTHTGDQFPAPNAAKTLFEQVMERPGIHAALQRFTSFSPRELDLLQFIALHPNLRGARLLHLLITHPGREHSALLLSGVLNGLCASCWLDLPASKDPGVQALPPILQPYFMVFEAAIPTTDPATIKDVRSRLKSIETLLSRKNQTPGQSTQLKKERQALLRYLRQVSTPGGMIRSFFGNDRKAGQSLSRSLHRFLDLIALQDPELANYTRAGLTLGKFLGWMPERESVKA